MKTPKNLCLTMLCAIVILLPNVVRAESPAASVVKVQGNVEVRDANGQVREQAKVGTTLKPGDSLHSSEKSMAAMRSSAGDVFVVDALAAARVRDNKNTFEHLLGKVLYLFKSGKPVNRTVMVKAAVIGIRGTAFLVDADADRTAIGMKEGAVEVESTGDGFNVYQRKEANEFEAFKQQAHEAVEREQKEFQRYREQTQEEFVAFKKSLQLKEQQSLSLSGNKAVIGPLGEDVKENIKRLEGFVSGVK